MYTSRCEHWPGRHTAATTALSPTKGWLSDSARTAPSTPARTLLRRRPDLAVPRRPAVVVRVGQSRGRGVVARRRARQADRVARGARGRFLGAGDLDDRLEAQLLGQGERLRDVGDLPGGHPDLAPGG